MQFTRRVLSSVERLMGNSTTLQQSFKKTSISCIRRVSFKGSRSVSNLRAVTLGPSRNPKVRALSISAPSGSTSSGTDPELGEEQESKEKITLPQLENVKIKTGEYVSSGTLLSQLPSPTLQEIAVIGRSNVGKSSLINCLTGRKSLALVSKTPGKTRTINHFLINKASDPWYLVDLPGYGYAKLSKTQRLEFFEFSKRYFLEREVLIAVLLLVDSSIPPMQADFECLSWLAEADMPVTVVFTKTDKRKKKCPRPGDNIKAFKRQMLDIYHEDGLPLCFRTSSERGEGKQELLTHLASLRQFDRENRN